MRADALIRVVQALVLGGKAALTQLGRNRAGSAQIKHHIKAVDRLLGNELLHAECAAIYRAIAQTLLHGVPSPVLTVDWFDFECGGSRKWAMLQAAVPVGGRTVVIFARVFPFKRYNSPGAHREFLHALKLVLPDDCKPIIITDAGLLGLYSHESAGIPQNIELGAGPSGAVPDSQSLDLPCSVGQT